MDKVNDIGNLQLLAAQLNEEKLNTDFEDWFNKEYPTESDKIQYRKINMIPDMDYSYGNFLDFIEKRNRILKTELMKILL